MANKKLNLGEPNNAHDHDTAPRCCDSDERLTLRRFSVAKINPKGLGDKPLNDARQRDQSPKGEDDGRRSLAIGSV